MEHEHSIESQLFFLSHVFYWQVKDFSEGQYDHVHWERGN